VQGSPSSAGLRVPPDLGPSQPLIGSALRDLDRRLSRTGALGSVAGEGRQMGPLFFDPEGADFTAWINHFKNEVYRNWMLPQAALLGFKGNVDLEFVVARDGTLSSLTLVTSAGAAALDRSAQNALLGSRLLALPADYGPTEVRMRVRFIYG
jgi:TonB family protein